MLTGTVVNLLVRLTRTDILMPSNHEHGTQSLVIQDFL